MNVTDERINLWAKPISETEEDKCSNAIRQISDVLKGRFGNTVSIVHQGSHRNRTNVRADSDVDIAVVYNDNYFSDVEPLSLFDQSVHFKSLVPSKYTFADYKNDVHHVLEKEFGVNAAKRKNKCIRVEGNTNRVHADVVPAFCTKRFSALGYKSHDGLGFIADDTNALQHSYPEHHYGNGVLKNGRTANTYKAVVRILKNARKEMEDCGLIPKDSMPSFFLECLVWNVADSWFLGSTYREIVRNVTAVVWGHMSDATIHPSYREVSDLKKLLNESHRTPAQAQAFMLQAWHYLAP